MAIVARERALAHDAALEKADALVPRHVTEIYESGALRRAIRSLKLEKKP